MLRIIRRRRQKRAIESYHDFALLLGQALSENHLGERWFYYSNKTWSTRDQETYHKLDELEEAYAKLGYRIVPLQSWIDFSGWEVPINHLLCQNRAPNERPQFSKVRLN